MYVILEIYYWCLIEFILLPKLSKLKISKTQKCRRETTRPKQHGLKDFFLLKISHNSCTKLRTW